MRACPRYSLSSLLSRVSPSSVEPGRSSVVEIEARVTVEMWGIEAVLATMRSATELLREASAGSSSKSLPGRQACKNSRALPSASIETDQGDGENPAYRSSTLVDSCRRSQKSSSRAEDS